MKTIRLGNDIQFVWTVEGLTNVVGEKLVQLFRYDNGIPETLTYSIDGDNITGLFKGKDQTEKGAYRLILYVNKGQNDMVTLDCVDAFELTGINKFGIVAGEDESAIAIATVNLMSTLDAAPTIPSIQAQADWEQDDDTKVDFIKNKPTLFSGDYEDLTNKPTIPDAQIQSDWNQSDSTKKDFIKNKPDIPSSLSDLSGDSNHRVVTDTEKNTWNNKSDFSGSYTDLTNKPSIPVVPTKVSAFINDVGYVKDLKTINGESLKGEGDIEIDCEQVQSDWNQNDSSKKDYIKHKPTIPVVPTKVSAFQNDAGYINDVSNKQDKLVSGTNIKTINNQSLLGSGNINIQGGGGSQVQSDWNQTDTSEPDYIKNKPTIPDVSGKADKATTLAGYGITDAKIESGVITLGSNTITPVTDISGKQDKIDSSHKLSADLVSDGSTNKVFTSTEQSKLSGIAAGAEVNVQSNWNESDTSSDAYIQNKPTIPDVSNCIQKSNTAGLVKNDGTIDTNTYLTSAHEVPSGGNAGQVLKKSTGTDYDYAWANQTQDYPSAYCTTSAGTAAKKAACSLYVAQANSYLHVLIGAANTSAGALTLNVNSAGAKPIYINGEASSSTNYTLPNGSYIVFYDGTNYYFRTDGKIQASATTVLANTSEVGGKEDKIAIDSTAKTASFTASVGNYYTVNIAASGSVTITLTTPTDNTHISNAVFLVTTSTSPALTFSAASGVDIYVSSSYSIEASKIYEINALWNGTNWSIASVELEAQS